MPIGRYLAWVGTSLLVLLFVANWFLPQPLAEPTGDEINRPVIRIASLQQPPERTVVDTNLPTIVPPPSLSPTPILVEEAHPSEPASPQSHAVPSIPSGVDQGKRKIAKRHGAKIAAKQPPLMLTPPVASNTAPVAPLTKLSFTDVVSGQLVRSLFNLR